MKTRRIDNIIFLLLAFLGFFAWVIDTHPEWLMWIATQR
jgi:hypothetical protein